MRFLFPALSLSVVAISLWVDLTKPSPSANVCLRGLCRYDQVYDEVDSEGANPANLAALLDEDPSNPSAWCTYAEMLAQRGDAEGAEAAFQRAVALGPGMAPILMRAANFEFARGHAPEAFALSKRILSETGAFDELVYSYFLRSGVTIPELLETAMPAEPRAAQTWLAWLKLNGTDQALVDTWSWMRQHHLPDQASALEFTWALWQRHRFAWAQQLWAGWADAAEMDFNPERLSNQRFQNAPNASPFDWKLDSLPSVTVSRDTGLDVRFSGTENVAFSGVRQFTTVAPGHYRFSAEIETHDLTTDQHPVFHIFDAEPNRRIDMETKPVAANAARSLLTAEFDVPAGVQAVEIDLERHPSRKMDSRIGGTLHVNEVSLTRR